MSQPDSESNKPAGILIRKPSTTIYTGLLGAALAALVIGCLALVLEIHRYDWIWYTPWN